MALIPGIICLFLGFCTRQAVGYGDGILLCALAMLYRLEDLLCILMIAILSAGITGLFFLIVLKKRGTYEIPFVPFLFVGWLCFYWGLIVERGIM
jgi:leader peptidase (prepilin peptidase)/N-methyltransferase